MDFVDSFSDVGFLREIGLIGIVCMGFINLFGRSAGRWNRFELVV
jgi:hypothetical protein